MKLISFFTIVFLLAAPFALAQSVSFPGPGLSAGTAAPATVTFAQAATNDSPASSTTTFASFNAGAGPVTAIDVWVRSGTTGFVSAVTVNGVSATEQVEVSNSGTDESSQWTCTCSGASISVVVTTGTTTPIAVYIGARAMANLTNGGTKSSSITGTTNNSAMVLPTVPAGGVALASGGDPNNNASLTWTGLTQDWYNHPSRSQGGASAAFATLQTNLSITGNFASPSSPVFVAASYR